MTKLYRVLVGVGVFAACPTLAGAVGTYYNGNLYQKPYARYSSGNAAYYNNYAMGRGYGQNMQQNNMQNNMQNMGTQKNTDANQQKKQSDGDKKHGFHLDAGVSHEFADWGFSMNQAGSKLKYDGLRWNVIDGNAAYYFGDSLPMQIKVGAKYGKQFDEITMIDDDITAEKMWDVQTTNVNTGSGTVTEDVVVGTPAVSLGTGKDGTQMGFNVAFGLTDFFKWGKMRVTPSVGYRYFKHELETKSNYGVAIQVLNSASFINCIEVQPGEIQCNPYVGFADANGEIIGYAGFATDGNGNIYVNTDGSYVMYNNTTAPQLDVGNTYYYEQSGTSHKYTTEWAGPYLALDMEYAINSDNFVSGGLEFGLPIYDSKGDQPYRIDWAHTTSVEDKGDFGDAYHLGLNANWATRVSESVCLTLGFTYDFYKVSDATAKTYLNTSYYEDLLYTFQTAYDEGRLTELGEDYLAELKGLKSSGWTIETPSEIESIYKSMGIRLGMSVKF